MNVKRLSYAGLVDFKIGHATNEQALTGCTTVICPEGAVAGVDVRGGAPGTRETDLLQPTNTVEQVHAVFLAGGSAFGLEAGSGIMRFLEEKQIGMDTGAAKVPIVPGAILFDLGVGDARIRPDQALGYQAALNAWENSFEVSGGNVGAGTGATVGKLLGEDYLMKSGIGYAGLQVGEVQLAAVVAVNAIGDIFDPATHTQIAGLYDREKKQLLNTNDCLTAQFEQDGTVANRDNSGKNTTIGVVMTNAKLTKSQTNKIAQLAHNGIARTIQPAHTAMDGDTLFAMSSSRVDAPVDLVGMLATRVVESAIVHAVKEADAVGNIPSYHSIGF
ncbi:MULTISPECIES: P1 family peptidase [Gracilibacillus]|uniref:P1 family peptidase n=1 Tax=Gracilibacillus TaxID=74385 RepID=UPI000A8896C0|nr:MULTISPECIES: P1 family peptidase [Gracilibacillus]